MSALLPKHGTSWEDDQSAGLNRCGDTKIAPFTQVHTDDWTECPVCHARLRLSWDVRVVEQGAPEEPDLTIPRPLSEWTEEDGECLWWHFPLQEPPKVGSPMDVGWGEGLPEGWHTHWTPLPRVKDPS